MNQRFQNADIKLVSEQYAEDELYIAISSIGLTFEAELTGFGLCSEECFKEVVEFLSAIADNGENIQTDLLEQIWIRKYNEYMRFDRHADDNIIRKAVGIVFGFVVLAVDSSSHPFYRYTLTQQLTEVLANHKFEGWTSTLKKIFEVQLPDGWFDKFIKEDSDESKALLLPKVLNTNRAQNYFKKAIDNGLMKIENNKLFWIGIGKTAHSSQLAYFCGRVYDYKNSINGNCGAEFPEAELIELFGVKRLYSLLTQVHDAKKKQKWRTCIDELFE